MGGVFFCLPTIQLVKTRGTPIPKGMTIQHDTRWVVWLNSGIPGCWLNGAIILYKGKVERIKNKHSLPLKRLSEKIKENNELNLDQVTQQDLKIIMSPKGGG